MRNGVEFVLNYLQNTPKSPQPASRIWLLSLSLSFFSLKHCLLPSLTHLCLPPASSTPFSPSRTPFTRIPILYIRHPPLLLLLLLPTHSTTTMPLFSSSLFPFLLLPLTTLALPPQPLPVISSNSPATDASTNTTATPLTYNRVCTPEADNPPPPASKPNTDDCTAVLADFAALVPNNPGHAWQWTHNTGGGG